MPVPAQPKIYHIAHVDRLPHIITAGYLYSDAHMQMQQGMGTTIGMSTIKARRLTLGLSSHPALRVGDCVPFYFCPRSVMLYLFYQSVISTTAHSNNLTQTFNFIRPKMSFINELSCP